MAKIGDRILGNGNVDQFLNLLERGKVLNYLRKNIQESTNFNLILWMYDRHKQQLTIKDNLSQSQWHRMANHSMYTGVLNWMKLYTEKTETHMNSAVPVYLVLQFQNIFYIHSAFVIWVPDVTLLSISGNPNTHSNDER